MVIRKRHLAIVAQRGLFLSVLAAVLSLRRSVPAELLQEDRLRDAALRVLEGKRVEGIDLDTQGRPVAGTRAGLFREEGGEWKLVETGAFGRVRRGLDGGLYAASGKKLMLVKPAGALRTVLEHAPGSIHDFAVDKESRAVVIGPFLEQDSVTWERDGAFAPRDDVGFYSAGGERLSPRLPGPHFFAWSVACDVSGTFWMGAKQGLYSWGTPGFLRHAPPGEELWMLGEKMDAMHVAREGSVAYANDLGVTRYDPRTSSWTGMRTDTHGVPFPYARAIAEEPGGELWIGGEHGAARRDLKGAWTYYQGEAWLPHDGVLAIAVAPDRRVLLGTESGLGVIVRRPVTLARKAEHFDDVAQEHHVNRYGFVWSVGCRSPGDVSTAEESGYTDNDGLWTASYIGSQCLRYAATRSEEARKNAKRSMDGILMLESVTGIPGYPARSYALAVDHQGDSRFEKWHRSPDGKYFWKGDTSSDEAVGHYFAHALYYDHVAGDAEKPVLRERLRAMTDHILDHGLAYVERGDGEPTRWGVWGPERCWKWGHYWYSSRLWSLCILSHLKVAGHVTGDGRYEKEYRRLIAEHDYARRTLGQKVTFGYVNHSDDQMAILSYYPLLRYETDPALRAMYLESLRKSWEIERPEASPLWNFVHNWAASNRDDLDRSIDHLVRMPWMLFAWSHDNTRRWDLPLSPLLRGGAESARALTMTERGPYTFTDNPYTLRSGDGGRTLESPAIYLLPYWLGRHHGLLGEGD